MKRKWLTACLMGAILLNGCASATGEGTDAAQGKQQATQAAEEAEAYRQLIAELQLELNAVKAEQQSQTEAYEARIQALEALLEEVEASRQGTPTTNESHGNQQQGTAEKYYMYVTLENGVRITAYLGTESLAEIPAMLNG